MSKPNDNNVKIKGDVKNFANATLKRFKKENKDYYDGKKETKRAYCSELIDFLPDVIEWVLRNGHIQTPEVQQCKGNIYAKFLAADEGEMFVEALIKEVKNGNDIENIKLLPIIIKDMLAAAADENASRVAEGRKDLVKVDGLVELNHKILKKKLKKTTEEGISEALAFDVLSTVPCGKAFDYSTTFRINSLFNVLYEHAKTEAVPFEKVMSEMVDDKFYKQIILFELLERKEKFAKLTDSQKEMYIAISAWCFKTLNDMSKNDIEDVINAYVTRRKNDAAQQKDSNRRYALASLSVDEYEKLAKIIARMIADDETIKTYLQ